MKLYNWYIPKQAQLLFDYLNPQPHMTRFVGGCVRNSFLGLPVADFDMATKLSIHDLFDICKKENLKIIPTGIDHGTVTILVDHMSFEVTRLRKDMNCDGRHADVKYTDDWQEDAKRRDFTMNALYVDDKGNIFDYVGGFKDLQRQYLCFIGDPFQRIQEDVLRILRFFRFAAYYHKGNLDQKALQAIEKTKNQLSTLSSERVRGEVKKIFDHPYANKIISLMEDMEIWQILGGHTINRKALNHLSMSFPDSSYLLKWAVLFPLTAWQDHLFRQFAVTKKEKRRIKKFYDQQYFLSKNNRKEENLLICYEMKEEIFDQIKFFLVQNPNDIFYKNLYEEAKVISWKKMPITGNDVMENLKISGEAVKLKLQEVKKWWLLNEQKPNKSRCIRYLLSGKEET